ncbi:MAG TPA: TrkA family potassium uptake protein [Acidimicrobiales bacterium]|nr:TrkA family potassium uptake protein [Acidimicrobiales bacterium]
MHVIIVGCGRVGSSLAVDLEHAGHSVTIMDKQPRAFRRLPEDWKGRTVTGFGFDRDDLEEAGAREASALAAVTSGDNSNILTARIARETYEIPNVVARIYDPRRAEIFQRLGIPTVPSVSWTTDQVLRRIVPDEGSFEWTDSTGSLHLVERVLPPAWAGRRLAEVVPAGIRIAAVTRGGSPTLAVRDLVGQEDDLLHLLVTDDCLPSLRQVFPGTAATRPEGGPR